MKNVKRKMKLGGLLILLMWLSNKNVLVGQDLSVERNFQVWADGTTFIGDYTSDSLGNSYLWTSFTSFIKFEADTGTITFASAGSNDLCLAKFDPTGKFLWAKQFGAASSDRAKYISIDKHQNVLISGTYAAGFDADPDTSTVYNLNHVGSNEVFLIKLDSEGDFLWANSINSSSSVSINSQSYVTNSNIYVALDYQDTPSIETNSGTTTVSTSNGLRDALVVCFNANGEYKWDQNFGGTSSESQLLMRTDASSNLFISMSTSGTYDLDPGAGVESINITGNAMPILFKLDSTGSFIWNMTITGTGFFNVYSDIEIDENNNVIGLIHVWSGNTINVPSGTGNFVFTSTSASSMYVLISVDNQGVASWLVSMEDGPNGYDNLEVDGKGHYYVDGFLNGPSYDLDPGAGTYMIENTTTTGNISKFDLNGNFIGAYNWFGNNPDYHVVEDSIYLFGTITTTFDIDPSSNVDLLNDTTFGNPIYMVKLTPCSSTDRITVSACDSFSISSINYINSGSYVLDSSLNAQGCDSVEYLDLTILKSSWAYPNLTECFSYESPSGKYVWDVSGIYYDTIPNSVGCDSVMQIDLLIKSVDTSITVIETTLLTDSSGDAYQWLDCNDNLSSFSDAFYPTFTPSVSGQYAVEVELDGCKDTSGCFEITVLTDGLLEKLDEPDLNVYPNPSNGIINIALDEKLLGAQITIKTVEGRTVYQYSEQNKLHIEVDQIFPSGMYLISVETKGYSVLNRKLIVR